MVTWTPDAGSSHAAPCDADMYMCSAVVSVLATSCCARIRSFVDRVLRRHHIAMFYIEVEQLFIPKHYIRINVLHM